MKKKRKSKENNPNKYDLIGFNRCIDVIKEKKLKSIEFTGNEEELKNKKIEIYEENTELIDKFIENNIYLSKIDLENDLYGIIPEELDKHTGKKDSVKWLQEHKLYNMVEFIESCMNEGLAKKIKENTQVLKEFVDNGR